MGTLDPFFSVAEAEITKILPATKTLADGTRIVFDVVPDPDAAAPSVYFGVDHGTGTPLTTGEGARMRYDGSVTVVASGNSRTGRKAALDAIAEIAKLIQRTEIAIAAGHRITFFDGQMIGKLERGSFVQYNWRCPFRREVPAG